VLLYCCWTCDLRGLKVSQGKVRTISRWGGISNHLSMAYLLSTNFAKITIIGQLLLKLSLVVGWYPFWDTVYIYATTDSRCCRWNHNFTNCRHRRPHRPKLTCKIHNWHQADLGLLKRWRWIRPIHENLGTGLEFGWCGRKLELLFIFVFKQPKQLKISWLWNELRFAFSQLRPS